jgi:phenylalanine-4-hydroxylase
MEALGEMGLEALRLGHLDRLARLYWYTVEFGLAREAGGLKIYGAGILSSFGESRFSLESPKPNRRPFDLLEVLRTRYVSSEFQRSYFVIDSFEGLLEQVMAADLPALFEEAAALEDLDPGRA